MSHYRLYCHWKEANPKKLCQETQSIEPNFNTQCSHYHLKIINLWTHNREGRHCYILIWLARISLYIWRRPYLLLLNNHGYESTSFICSVVKLTTKEIQCWTKQRIVVKRAQEKISEIYFYIIPKIVGIYFLKQGFSS